MSRSVCQRCGASFQGVGCHLCGDTLLTHAPKDPLLGKIFAGRYRIIRKLGQGGMGAVYLAEQVGIGHRVALKLLNANLASSEEIAQRFLNEAKSYARIAHPHAVAFHEFGQDEDGTLFISTEYIEGPDLKNYLVERGRLAPEEAVEVILQIADALEHAHQNGVIHRDLKPENVIVRQGMRGIHAKVLDFGIARLLEEGSSRLTAAGSIAGTPQYMSPEQVRGQDVDARADVYVIGVLFFELLTGVQPFAAATIPEMLYRQVHDPVPPLSTHVPNLEALDPVIQRATAKDPAARQPSMAAFASELLAAAAALPSDLPRGDTSLGVPVPSAFRRSTSAEGVKGTLLHGQPPGAPDFSGTVHDDANLQASGVAVGHADTLLNTSGIPEPGAGAGTGTLLQTGSLPAGAPSEQPPSAAEGEKAPSAPGDPGAIDLRGEAWGGPPVGRDRQAGRKRSPLGAAVIGLVLAGLLVGGAYALEPGWFEPILGAPPSPQSPALDAASAPAGAPAAAAAKAPAAPAPQAAPEDRRLRQELLATEIWLKANAEFLSGNLQSAQEILDTVPDEETTAEKVATLRANIEEVSTRLARGRAAAAKGDCVTAISNYRAILARFPGIREAARGQQACQQMLPPTLAE